MLLDPELLRTHLQEVADIRVWETYLVFGFARLPNGMTVRPAAHGYIARELRFEKSDTWYFSAVLNKRWVLWYFRNPAMREGLVDAGQTRQRFAASEPTQSGDIKLRVEDIGEAYSLLDWISDPRASEDAGS